MTVNELRLKRAKAWEACKQFLDSHRGENGLLSAEDETTYNRMEADVESYGREIERLERQNATDARLGLPATDPILMNPQAQTLTGPRTSDEYRTGFWNYVRIKNAPVSNVMSEGTNADGGYLVPVEYEKTLIKALDESCVMRKIARHIPMSGKEMEITKQTGNSTGVWMAENAVFNASQATFDQVKLTAHKAGILTTASEELVQDAVFDIEDFISKDFANQLGVVEEAAFITGDGSGKPTGVLAATGGAATGVTAASATAIAADELIDLYYSVKSPYRVKSHWLMNDQTAKVIRKLKDNQNNYLWQPGIQAGTPDTVLGRPVVYSAAVPTVAASARPIAFGDFSYYWIGERKGISIQRLNELFAGSGQIGFLATMRVGGKLMLDEAVKALVMGA